LTGNEKVPTIDDLASFIEKLQLNKPSTGVSQEPTQKSPQEPQSAPQEEKEGNTSTESAVQSKEEQTKKNEKIKYPNTAKKVLRMLKQLYETGFASFA